MQAIAPSAQPDETQPPVAGLTALQRLLASAVDGMRREPSGRELLDAIMAQAEADFSLIGKPGTSADENMRLRALAGKLFGQCELAELVRGGVVESIAEALGDPKAWLLACRALKHVPAWVFESRPERAARVSAEQQRRSAPSHRPGKQPVRPLFPAQGRSENVKERRADARAQEYDAADGESEEDGSWGSVDPDEHALKLWESHHPDLAYDYDIHELGIEHYLTQCQGMEVEDLIVLDADLLASGRDLSDQTRQRLQGRCKRLWRAVLDGTWLPKGRELRNWRSGRALDREAALRRIEALRDVDENW